MLTKRVCGARRNGLLTVKGEDIQIRIGTQPVKEVHVFRSGEEALSLCAPLVDRAEMFSVVRTHIIPALRLYVHGLKVLLVQLFSGPFRLPGQFDTVSQVSQCESEQHLVFVATPVWLIVRCGEERRSH